MKKNQMKILSLLIVAALVIVQSCSKKSDPQPLNISSILAGTVDINGATPPTNVDPISTIVVTFTSNVDPATAIPANVTLTRTDDNVAATVAVTSSGLTLTITPSAPMSAGNAYSLDLGAGLKSTDGVSFTSVTRTFTIIGAFAPAGAVAYWTFENTPNDLTGTYTPSGSGVVDVTYATGRNTGAGMAASFNGTTSIIEYPNGPDLVNTADFSLSVWVKPDSAAHHGGNFVLGIGGYHGFEFEMSKNDAKLSAQYAIGSTTSISKDLWLDGTGNVGYVGWTYSKDLTDGKTNVGFAAIVQELWSHFVFTYESSTKIGTIYLNGVKVKSQDFNLFAGDAIIGATGLKFSPDATVGTNFVFGYYSDRATTAFSWATYSDVTTNHYKGLIDDVYIYHSVLTPSNITQMYNTGK